MFLDAVVKKNSVNTYHATNKRTYLLGTVRVPSSLGKIVPCFFPIACVELFVAFPFALTMTGFIVQAGQRFPGSVDSHYSSSLRDLILQAPSSISVIIKE